MGPRDQPPVQKSGRGYRPVRRLLGAQAPALAVRQPCRICCPSALRSESRPAPATSSSGCSSRPRKTAGLDQRPRDLHRVSRILRTRHRFQRRVPAARRRPRGRHTSLADLADVPLLQTGCRGLPVSSLIASGQWRLQGAMPSPPPRFAASKVQTDGRGLPMPRRPAPRLKDHIEWASPYSRVDVEVTWRRGDRPHSKSPPVK
jgi:hypothetical protein